MPPPMIIAGRFTGGATMPRSAPMAIRAAAVTLSRPMIRSTGAMMLPADRTAAVEEPVIIPGNMMTIIIRIRRMAGCL